MRPIIIIPAAVALLLLQAAVFGWTPQTGVFEMKWDAQDAWPAADQPCEIDKDVKALIRKLPELPKTEQSNLTQSPSDAQPVFTAIRIDGNGSRGLVAVMFCSSNGGVLDQAYVDANRNWDLSDESPVYISQFQQVIMGYSWVDLGQEGLPLGEVRESDWVTVQPRPGHANGRPCQIRLTLEPELDSRFYALGETVEGDEPAGPRMRVRVERKGAWKGTMHGPSGTVDIFLIDQDCNGVWGNPARIDKEERVGGDLLLAGKESITLWPITPIGGKFYTILTNVVGGRLAVRAYAGSWGNLLVPSSTVAGCNATAQSLRLRSGETGSFDLTHSAPGVFRLPKGSYSVRAVDLILSRPGKGSMKLSGLLEKGLNRTVGASIAKIKLGGSLSHKINQYQTDLVTFTAGTSNDFYWLMSAGAIAEVTAIGDKGNVAAPRVQLIDSSGRLVMVRNSGYT